MSADSRRFFDFGPFRLEPENRLLLRDSLPISLTPKAFDTLLLLVGRSGRLVPKDDLMKALWPDTFVDESNLTQTVFMLRKALGDTGSDQRYIVTVPGSGYRFSADVKLVSETGEPPPEVPVAAPQPGVVPPVQESSPRRWPILVGASLVLVAALAAYFHGARPWVRPPAPGAKLMLAVLPFANLTGDAGQDYFSDGFTEEMITQLGKLDPQRLAVIARTSVMHYKNSQESLEQIGNALGVQYVLEGSVRGNADKVRITAQLIQLQDQTHLWAREYDRQRSDLLLVQGEIAQKIAEEIQLTLGDNHQRIVPALTPQRSPTPYEAYDLYLKGRYFANKRTAEGLQQAIEYFQQAVAKDPANARAYAGLADSYALISGYSLVPPKEVMPKAHAAALRALEIDPGLAEAHTSLAVIAQDFDWDWPTAEKEYRRAIQLDPNYATAHHWYAEYLALQGRFDEAFPEIERARQLDPLSLIIAADRGAILYFSRQYDRAIAQLRAVLEMEPNFPRAQMVVYADVQKGSFADALADIKNWRQVDASPWSWAMLAYVYGRSGQPAQARRALQELEELNRRRPIDPLAIAIAYIGVNDTDRALAWLQKACAEHSISLTALKVDPTYDPLRGDPRFQELLRQVGLAQ